MLLEEFIELAFALQDLGHRTNTRQQPAIANLTLVDVAGVAGVGIVANVAGNIDVGRVRVQRTGVAGRVRVALA
ncbi:hypothetical protein [Paenarthrobacter nitroguajacolicus]|uniref:hypothetical protein n=1 Tax=Paenarthrobacter nitroguajacolicus TaxID=211146 RepID=UPI001FCA5957|nr:hypothetical protein [Paenarthrobacter nitroguajacolicus]